MNDGLYLHNNEATPLLADCFLDNFNKQNRTQLQFSETFFIYLKNVDYDWPGNVRELENVIKGAASYSRNKKFISIEHLQRVFRDSVNKYQKDKQDEQDQKHDLFEEMQQLLKKRKIPLFDVFIANCKNAYFDLLLKNYNEPNAEEAEKISGIKKSTYYSMIKKLKTFLENYKNNRVL